MWPVKTILNPSDFSEPSADAHQTACEIARQFQARVIFLHVADKPVVTYIRGASELPPDQLQHKLWETLRWPQEFEKGLKIEHRVTEGNPVNEILRVAEEVQCDLIVMGTQGRKGMSHWIAGSVAEEVIRKASCSVLVAKHAAATA